jgi:hypothetical protein
MRTFAQPTGRRSRHGTTVRTGHRTTSGGVGHPPVRSVVSDGEAGPLIDPRPAAHDFGSMPVRPVAVPAAPTLAMAARAGRAEGETTEDDLRTDIEGSTPSVEGEVPADAMGPLRAGDTRAVPHTFAGTLPAGVVRSASFHPDISVVNAGARTSDCGGYSYKVRWGIPAAASTASGWIVQKVNKTFRATDSAGHAVTPQAFDDPAGYPFWEAWEFTSGQHVWVGPSAGGTAHSGDTFSGADYGPGTKGRKTVTGEVKAIVGFTPPAGMTVRNAAPAWALPYTRTQPALFGSTLAGAAHTLTAEWDCTPTGTVTQATTVATRP